MENNYRVIESNLNNEVFLVWDNEEFSVHKIDEQGELISGKYFNNFMEANLYFNQFRDKNDTLEEYCSNCGEEAILNYDFKIQKCSECGELIFPCSLCEMDYVNCFGECPLNKVKKYMLELNYNYDDLEYLTNILNVKLY